jgi:hypothetical protein
MVLRNDPNFQFVDEVLEAEINKNRWKVAGMKYKKQNKDEISKKRVIKAFSLSKEESSSAVKAINKLKQKASFMESDSECSANNSVVQSPRSS